MITMSTASIPEQAVTITAVTDGSVTAATARMAGISVTAFARREPGDKPDAATGADLATARALARLAGKLERRARGRVRNAEAVAAHRRERNELRRGADFSGLTNLRAGTPAAGKSRGVQAELVPVSELFVKCSYPQRPDVKAASDTCQDIAHTAVQDDEGALWYRCPDHEGQLAPGITGRVVARIPREKRPATTRKQDRK